MTPRAGAVRLMVPAAALMLGACAQGLTGGASVEPATGPTTDARVAVASLGGAGLDPAPAPAEDLSDLERGLALLRAGAPGQAHRAFMRALRTGRRPAAALTGAGLAAEARGMLTPARRYFEMARDLAPHSDVVHNNLGVVLYRLGEYEAAERSFRTAFALSSGQNRAALGNLHRAEARADARLVPPDPAVSHRLQRTGKGSYRLVAIGDTQPSRAVPHPG